MAIIEPNRKEIATKSRIKKHSAPLRFWHWANAIVISGSLITVLVNSTITDEQPTAALIKENLQKAGASITAKQANSAAHALGDNVWNIHIYFGYALAALLSFRLVLEFFQLADQKFIRKIKMVYGQFKITKANREQARHELMVKMIYSLFYIVLIIMVITGLFLAFEDALVAYKSIRPSVKQVHGFCMYLVITFIIVHLAGVFLAERKESAGIVSDMINGGKDQ
jgi:Ni/Fe-hydrogenase 1 B-type cytochrome subunit